VGQTHSAHLTRVSLVAATSRDGECTGFIDT